MHLLLFQFQKGSKIFLNHSFLNLIATVYTVLNAYLPPPLEGKEVKKTYLLRKYSRLLYVHCVNVQYYI